MSHPNHLEPPDDDPPSFTYPQLLQMDAAFCAAMRREIARGTERARGPDRAPPSARLIRIVHPPPLFSGASSAAELCAEIGDRGGEWDEGSDSRRDT
jgi:hypothetical protein